MHMSVQSSGIFALIVCIYLISFIFRPWNIL